MSTASSSNDPDQKTSWAIAETAGDQSRDYATRRLWITPAGWTDGPFKLADHAVGIEILTDGAFKLACWPEPLGACMRAWPHEVKIHLKAGTAGAELIAHEFGHYAAGYIFGHMDAFKIDSRFEFTQCDIRAFQETIAEVFAVLLMHEVAGQRVSSPAGTQWTNTCGATPYTMGLPLVEAFEDAIRAASTTSPSVPWSSPAVANAAMADAFVYGLVRTSGHKIDNLAYAMLRWLGTNHPQQAPAVRAIFAAHGMAPMRLGDACSVHEGCASGHCDAGWGTSKTDKCVPAPETGASGDYCSHDNQCRTQHCLGLKPAPSGGWTAGTCGAKVGLGVACSQHYQCASGHCDAGWNSSKTDRCVPGPGAGAGGQFCSDHRQCNSQVCTGLRPGGSGQWIPGTCSSQLALGRGCSQHQQCASGYCDSGWNTSKTDRCMPRNGQRGDICSHPNQCTNGVCIGLRASGNQWIPGTCN